MTQVSDIIVQALRESNIIAVNANPNPSENAEALSRLQALVLSALGNEVGYIMEDWNIASAASILKPSGVPLAASQAAAWRVPPNARLICNLGAPLTITLDPQPQDGQRFSIVDAGNTFDASALTLATNGRKVNGEVGTVEFAEKGVALQWLYRSDIANWVLIDPLAVADDMPFPPDFDDYFVIMLAMRMNPRYGKELNQQSLDRLAQQRMQFIKRYAQTRLNLPAEQAPQQ